MLPGPGHFCVLGISTSTWAEKRIKEDIQGLTSLAQTSGDKLVKAAASLAAAVIVWLM